MVPRHSNFLVGNKAHHTQESMRMKLWLSWKLVLARVAALSTETWSSASYREDDDSASFAGEGVEIPEDQKGSPWMAVPVGISRKHYTWV